MKRINRDLLAVIRFKENIHDLYEKKPARLNRNQLIRSINLFLKDFHLNKLEGSYRFQTPIEYLFYSKQTNKIKYISEIFCRCYL